VLGEKKDQALLVSGGSGQHYGDWIGSRPPSDVLTYSRDLRAGGTNFVFQQLKKDTVGHTYSFLINDTAGTPQRKEVKIKLPKE